MCDLVTSTPRQYDFFKNGSDIRVTWHESPLGLQHHDIPRKFFDIIRDEHMMDVFKKWTEGEIDPDHRPFFIEICYFFSLAFSGYFRNQKFFILFKKNLSNEKIIVFTEIKDEVRSWTISSECYNQMLSITNLDKLKII